MLSTRVFEWLKCCKEGCKYKTANVRSQIHVDHVLRYKEHCLQHVLAIEPDDQSASLQGVSCDVWFSQCVRKDESCDRINYSCFKTTMPLLTMVCASSCSWPRRSLPYKHSIPIHMILLRTTFFFLQAQEQHPADSFGLTVDYLATKSKFLQPSGY